MSIQADVNQLKILNEELKRLRLKIKSINNTKKQVEERIINFLKAKDQPGVKYQGDTIILDTQQKRNRKPQKDKEQNALNVLRTYNIHNPEEALKDILEGMKGDVTTVSKLKIKKSKQS